MLKLYAIGNNYKCYSFKNHKKGKYIYIYFADGLRTEIYIEDNKMKTIKILNEELLYKEKPYIQPTIYKDNNVIDKKYNNIVKNIFEILKKHKLI